MSELTKNELVKVREAVMEAFSSRKVSPANVAYLKRKGLLEPAPRGRGGEKWLFHYDFTEVRYRYPSPSKGIQRYGARPEDVRCVGFLGFGGDLRLVVVDERYPYEVTFSRIYSKPADADGSVKYTRGPWRQKQRQGLD